MRSKEIDSPYFGVDPSDWAMVTRRLLSEHPLSGPTLVETVLSSWASLFHSTLGSGFRIGREMFPVPQIMGFFLHALIPLELAKSKGGWRIDAHASEKDLVCDADPRFSMEIKTSSHASQIFGNRSFGVPNSSSGKKAKDGYYLAVNFGKWESSKKSQPEILLIRFGWLDRTDWVAQRAETGQQSSLPSAIENNQLLTLYSSATGWRVK